MSARPERSQLDKEAAFEAAVQSWIVGSVIICILWLVKVFFIDEPIHRLDYLPDPFSLLIGGLVYVGGIIGFVLISFGFVIFIVTPLSYFISKHSGLEKWESIVVIATACAFIAWIANALTSFQDSLSVTVSGAVYGTATSFFLARTGNV